MHCITRVVVRLGIFLSICSLLLLFMPGISPDIKFTSFRIEVPDHDKFAELFESNSILDDAEVYYEHHATGLESVVELDDGSIVSGDNKGNLFKIIGKQATVNITRLQYACGASTTYGATGNNGCGWALGIVLNKKGNLIVMDLFGGLVEVDIDKGTSKLLHPKHIPIENKISQNPEDVDIANDGTIYWTDGCTYGDFFTEMYGEPSGRLIKYDPTTKTNQVLLDDLHFSNGICLANDESFVLVAEMGSACIRRYYLKGEKKGQNDIFIKGLPGFPDNIRSNGKGGFYVALFSPWNKEYSLRTHLFSPYPLLRKFMMRVQHLLLSIMHKIQSFYPGNIYLDSLEFQIKSFGPILRALQHPKLATILELSKTGEIIGMLNGRNGKLHSISQITVGKVYAYIVNPFSNKVWRIGRDALDIRN